jgi:drug/metabolite transporter (DMT)-like permease
VFGAIGTALCFAITPVFAHQAARRLGSVPANFWRLALAALVLGGWAQFFGTGVGSAPRTWFILGGIAGFGIGGVAMFLSLPRLGSNLSTLIVQCLAAVAAAVMERLWLGTMLTGLQLASVVLTVSGVALGLLPRSLPRVAPALYRTGLGWAVLSAMGQGAGAVMSRKAFGVANALHEAVDPGTAAFHRVVGGLLVAVAVLTVLIGLHRARLAQDRRAVGWVAGNALTGPILGVTCYQWALRTSPAALVQPLVAMAPLLTIPFAHWLEGAPAPRPVYYIGSALAILGAIGIVLAR